MNRVEIEAWRYDVLPASVRHLIDALDRTNLEKPSIQSKGEIEVAIRNVLVSE